MLCFFTIASCIISLFVYKNFSNDNKYKTNCFEKSGLWIKDEVDGKNLNLNQFCQNIIIYPNLFVNEFNENF